MIQLLYVSQKGGLCWFILSGATYESTKLMQYKLVVYNSKKEFEGYQEVFGGFETEGWFNNSTIKQKANIYVTV
jgi:hypothetical protein